MRCPTTRRASTIMTNSSVGGSGDNEIRFEDKKDSEEIYLQAQKDMNVLVKNNWTETIHNARTATIEESDETLTVSKGNRSVTVSKGNDTHTVSEGNHTVSIAKGNETYGVKGDARSDGYGGPETHTNSDAFTHKVTGDYTLEVGGNLTIKGHRQHQRQNRTGGTVAPRSFDIVRYQGWNGDDQPGGGRR